MRARSVASTLIAAITVLASNVLVAQAPPTVVVGFAGAFAGASAVPLDPWSSVAAGLLIAGAAYAFFRRSGAGRCGRLSVWLAVVAATTGAVIGTSRVEIISTAHAIVPSTQLLLTSSPASLVVGSGTTLVDVLNATGAPVTITSVNLLNPAANQVIAPFQGLNCAPGLVLPAGQSCNVLVDVLS